MCVSFLYTLLVPRTYMYIVHWKKKNILKFDWPTGAHSCTVQYLVCMYVCHVYVCVCVYGRYVCHMYECGTSRVGCMHAHVKVIQSSLESDLRFVCTILLSTPDLSHALLSFVCSPLCYASLFLCIRMEKKMCNLSNDTIHLNPRRNQQQRII